MTKGDLLNLSKKYLIASADLAQKIHDEGISAITLPAFEHDFGYAHFALHQDDDGQHIQFFADDGVMLRQAKSHYAVDNYVYVREPYWLDGDEVKYFADFNPGIGFIKARVTPGKYMRKIHARSFLHITKVSVRRLMDTTPEELSKLGFDSPMDHLDFYDGELSEKRYEAYRSYKNPYVFYYEFEVIEAQYAE